MGRNRTNQFVAKPWHDIALFEEPGSGKSLEAFLRTKGIEARTHHEKALQYILFLHPPRTIFRVQIRHNISKGAINLLLNEPDAAAILETAVHCPGCGSLQVEYPQLARKFFLPTVRLQLGLIFRLREHQCHCVNCHCTWELPPKADPAMPEPAMPQQKPG